MFENLDTAILELFTYQGKPLAEWQAIQDRRGRTDHEMEKEEMAARVAQYRQSIERGDDLSFIPRAQTLTS